MGKRGVAAITNEDCIGRDEMYDEFYSCSCGIPGLVDSYKFCPFCGMRLVWKLEPIVEPIVEETPIPVKTIEEVVKDIDIGAGVGLDPWGFKKVMP